jgi:hypothetical protein
VRPRNAPLPIGTQLANVADVYFDYLKPIRTGEVTTIIGPDAPWLIDVADGSGNVARNPRFRWSTVQFANSYQLQITTDSTFTTITRDTIVESADYLVAFAMPLDANTRHHWRARSLVDTIHSPWSEISSFNTNDQLGVEHEKATGTAQVVRVRPNPSYGKAYVEYAIGSDANVSLNIFDARGRRISSIAEGWHSAGQHRVEVDLSGYPSGHYMLELCAGGQCLYGQMVIQR